MCYLTHSTTAANSLSSQAYGPRAQIAYGTDQAGFLPTCFQNLTTGFDVDEQSVLATKKAFAGSYSYAGNSKIVDAYYTVNSTMAFSSPGSVPAISNVEVAISNFTDLGINDCQHLKPVIDYDEAILGLAAGEGSADGPFFRRNLFDQGKISSRTMSMWMDKASTFDSTIYGSVLFGAVAPSKYSGDLVFVNLTLQSPYAGYHVSAPVISVSSIKEPRKYTYLTSMNTTQAASAGGLCLVDSGSTVDTLPVDGAAFSKAAGLDYESYSPAINGSCEQIPEATSVRYEFAAINGGEPLGIEIPLRLYARNVLQYNENACTLSLQFAQTGCLFSAAFMSGAYIAVDDTHTQLAMAQGAVSKRATEGVFGLGDVKYITSGGQIPAR